MTTLGRAGQGPEEFGSWPGPVFADSATGEVHIFDPINRKRIVADRQGNFLRSVPSPSGVTSAAALPGSDRAVVVASIRSAESFGQPLHVLEGDRIVRSFGQTDEPGVLHWADAQRHLATDVDGRIFAAHLYEYTIDVFDDQGTRLGRFLGPTLNDGRPAPGFITMENPPRSRIEGIRFDGRHLWVLIREPQPDWRDAAEEGVSSRGQIIIVPPGDDWDLIWDTRIDVIDLRKGTLLATGRLPVRAIGFGGDQVLLINQETAGGVPQLAVWHLALR